MIPFTPGAPLTDAADESAIRAIPQRLVDAWNRGSGEDFAAPFAEHANFIAFEGTALEGRRRIAAFHQHVFDNVVKGTRLEGEAKFVRFFSQGLAVMHATARVALPGQPNTSPSRDSMQLFVVAKRDGEWLVETALNARKLTPERQFLLDDFEMLNAEDQRRAAGFIASLEAD
jgi:uncharacterized protein (TIGR02246 family)